MIGRRVSYVELTVPRTSTILIPDIHGMKHPEEVVSFMDAALEWSRNDELRAYGRPLVEALAARFRDTANDADQDATLVRMCGTTCYLGFAAAAQEIADFQPPPFRVHPIVHTALAEWCFGLSADVFPGDLKIMGAYCIRAGHYVGRTQRAADLFA